MFDACFWFRKFIIQPLLLGICLSCLAVAEDMRVSPPESQVVELKPHTIGAASKSIDAEKLRNLLAPYGWRVEQDGQGGVLLYPRATERPKATAGEATDSGVTSSVPLGQGFTAGDIERLRGMLSPHGWRVEADGTGGVLLYPRAAEVPKVRPTAESGPSVPSTIPLGQGFTEGDVIRLRGMLSPHGWRVEADGTGGVLLYPRAAEVSQDRPTVESGPSVPSTIPLGQGFTEGDVERLQGMLSPHGWRVEADGTGGVLLYPRSAEPPLPALEDSSMRKSTATVMPHAGFTSRDIARLRGYLAPHGWRVEADGAGGVLLYPGAFTDHSVPRTASSTRAQSGITSVKGFTSGDLEILRATLAPHGWHVEGDSRGGLVLIPQPPSAQESVTTYVAARSWSGVILPEIQRGTIGLPVDSWEKAHRLTLSWIELSGQNDLVPGKIRNINKVYLISVVSRIPPHTLRHQLVFREEDGHMFLVY